MKLEQKNNQPIRHGAIIFTTKIQKEIRVDLTAAEAKNAVVAVYVDNVHISYVNVAELLP